MNYLIDYSIKDNCVEIEGTNEAGDLLVSAACFPWFNGVHFGISMAVSFHYKKITAKLNKGEEVKMWAYSMGAAFALELTRRLVRDGYSVFCAVRGAYPVHLFRQELDEGVICRRYGNDVVTKLFPWFRLPFNSIRDEGPRRRWFKFSFKDHLKY